MNSSIPQGAPWCIPFGSHLVRVTLKQPYESETHAGLRSINCLIFPCITCKAFIYQLYKLISHPKDQSLEEELAGTREPTAERKRTTMMTEEYMLTTMTFVYDETVHLYSHETQELTCTLRNVDKDGEESRGRAASNNLRAQLTVILF